MRKTVAEIWCQALRSGEFVQTKGQMDDGTRVDVLGVLVNLAMTVGVCDYTPVWNGGAFDNNLGQLPQSVVEWAGMKSPSGVIEGEFVTLCGLNDFCDYDFKDLANVIEESYEKL